MSKLNLLSRICKNPQNFYQRKAKSRKSVIVEFSSPNIAKPFHVGHLRSTLLGNYICNINEAMGHKVTRINYLGDWGTQFGVLLLGCENQKFNQLLEEDFLKKMFDIYVWANAQIKQDKSLETEARRIFNELENGNYEFVKKWKLLRDTSIKAFNELYKRLNVYFDELHSESMYDSSKFKDLLREYKVNKNFTFHNDGQVTFSLGNDSRISFIKSDGSSLYLSRDLLAAIDRFNKFKFDESIYVVDASQQKHFEALFKILKDLNYNWVQKMKHIRFGRIIGLSTRKGQAIFLEDVLNTAQKQMQIRHESTTGKHDLPVNERLNISDSLGLSGIVVADFKRRRLKDYKFNWDEALQNSATSGIRLQYCHCRLVSLEMNCGVDVKDDVDVQLLVEKEAMQLMDCLQKFDECLERSYEELEPYILVNYLFTLCKCINICWKVLTVKNTKIEVAQARLLLMQAARHTLAAGMKVLGLTPLMRM